jgi:hypothetical protein
MMKSWLEVQLSEFKARFGEVAVGSRLRGEECTFGCSVCILELRSAQFSVPGHALRFLTGTGSIQFMLEACACERFSSFA